MRVSLKGLGCLPDYLLLAPTRLARSGSDIFIPTYMHVTDLHYRI